MEKVCAIILPDAVAAGHVSAIKLALEEEGFSTLASATMRLNRREASDFYAEKSGQHRFSDMVKRLASGPVEALVLARVDAVATLARFVGSAEAGLASRKPPPTLRAKFAADAVHGSDSPLSAAREIRFLFPSLAQRPDGDAAEAYIADKVHPTLQAALTALCREHPSDDPVVAAGWLADWLTAHNPNKGFDVGTAEIVEPPESISVDVDCPLEEL